MLKTLGVLSVLLLCLSAMASELSITEIKEPGIPDILYIQRPADKFDTLSIFVPNTTLPRPGTPHMAEHLMFASGRELKNGELDNLLETMGYSADAYTSYDFTAYRTVLRHSDLEGVLALFAKALSGPLFTEEELALEKKIINDEASGKADASSDTIKNRLLGKLYGDTLYGLPLEGSIDSITRDDLLLYHELNYKNANMLFVLAGNSSPEELKALIGKYFPAKGERSVFISPGITAAKGIVSSREGVLYGLGCAMAPANMFGQSVCCSVLSSLIYGKISGELRNCPISYSHNTGRWTSPFILTVRADSPAAAAEAEAICTRVIEAVKKGDYTDSELSAAKSLQLTDFLTRNQNGRSLTYQLGQMYLLHGLKALGEYSGLISGVNRQDIALAAEKYL